MDVRTANAEHRSAPLAPEAFGGLPADAAIRGLVAACDIALLVNDRGIIETVTLGAADLADRAMQRADAARTKCSGPSFPPGGYSMLP